MKKLLLALLLALFVGGIVGCGPTEPKKEEPKKDEPAPAAPEAPK
jgi:predicted small lipoprotein YifL